MRWDQKQIADRLKSAECDRGSFLTNLCALRLANLSALIEKKGIEYFGDVISGSDTRAIEELPLPVKGVGQS